MRRWASSALLGGCLVLGAAFSTSCGLVEGDAQTGGVPPGVLITRATAGYETEVLFCSEGHDPVSLDVAQYAFVSPNGRFVALQRSVGAVIVDLSTLQEVPLPGDAPTLAGARWSPGSDRLAYLASGVPHLVSADASWSAALDELTLPSPSPEYEYQGAEWSKDGQQVAFVTRRLGILTNRNGDAPFVFSDKMIGPYGCPWALGFSPDGTTLAGLQTEEPAAPTRTVLLVDLATRTTREVGGIDQYSLVGWTSDSSAVGVWDTYIRLWLVPKNGDPPRHWDDATGFPSPTAPEAALGDAGLFVEDLHDGSVRTLVSEDVSVSNLRWEAQGQVIWYASGEGSHFLRASDGEELASAPSAAQSGVVRDDGWALLIDPEDPDVLLLGDLLGAPESFFAVYWGAADQAQYLVYRVQWLGDDRVAILAADGLRIASTAGPEDHLSGPDWGTTICPAGDQIVAPQRDTLDARF